MPNFLKIIISLALVMAVFYFTSTPSPTTTLVRLGFLAAKTKTTTNSRHCPTHKAAMRGTSP